MESNGVNLVPSKKHYDLVFLRDEVLLLARSIALGILTCFN
jgi:hypothetical protein